MLRDTLAFVAAAAFLAPAAASSAEKLDKDAKKWLDDVRPLILPEEEKAFRELKDKSERDEFQRIFWARRDPDLQTPANEFRTEYEKTVADVDTRLRLSGKPGPGTALLKAPRQDFPVSAQSKMFLRSPGGTSYVAGLVRGDATGLTVQDAGGKKTVTVVVAAQAVDESGKPAATTEREMVADVGPDNSFVASYGMALKPGSYTLNVGALDPAGHKGSVASTPLKMPDFGTDELAISELMVLQDAQEVASVSPQDPFGAFALGNTRVLPRFGNVFAPSESIMLLGVAYNAKVDEAT